MKLYEVRCNKNNSRVCLLRHGFLSSLAGEIIYDGDDSSEILKSFIDMGDGFFRPEFGNKREAITNKKLISKGFHTTNKKFKWVVSESDHRPDVRVITEDFYNKLLNNETEHIIVTDCDHLDSEYPESFEPIYLAATKAYHQMGEISREQEDVAIVSQKNDDFYCGRWAEGFGFVQVKFPVETSRVITKEEANEIIKSFRG